MGSFYRTDDRTGFPVRAEATAKEWNGLIVDRARFEPRQPQDLVRGVPDDQSVRDARPLAPNQFVGPVWTTTSSAIAVGADLIPVTSVAGFSIGDLVSIMLDNGSLFLVYVTDIIDGPAIYIGSTLPCSVSDGAQVWNMGAISGGPDSLLGTESDIALATESGMEIAL